MANHYDWGLIRDEYAAGGDDVTLELLTEKYGCYPTTMRNRAGREGWGDMRRQFRDKVAAKTAEKASSKEAEIRARHIGMAKLLMEKAIRGLKALDPDDLSPSEFRLYIKDAAEIERKAAGIPDAHEVKAIISEKLSNEVEAFIEELESKLPPEIMGRVIAALTDHPEAAGTE